MNEIQRPSPAVIPWHQATDEQKRQAQQSVNTAVKRGDIPKARHLTCAWGCGYRAFAYHHEDYHPAKWLAVIALCQKCHHQRHKQMLVEVNSG